MTDIEEHIASLEEELRQAMLHSDVDALDRLVSDDLVFTTHFGQRLGKQADLDMHRSGVLQLNTLEPSERLLKLMGQVVVVSVRMKVAGAYEEGPFAADLRYTRIWQKTAGGWCVVAGHSSAIQG